MKHRSTDCARFALTGVALAAGCLFGSQAWALGLGRLSVQSALGETLKAEIDVTAITAEEASSLRLRVAPPEAFRAAGVEYNAALASAQVVLQRRPDGRQVLRVTSERAVLEPFVDVILEASWATGRLVREYTMLFDPPGSTRMAQAPAAAPAVTPAPPMPAAPTAAPPAAAAMPVAPSPPVVQSPLPPPPVAQASLPPVAPAPRPRPAAEAPAAAPSMAPSAAAAAPSDADAVRVRTGDTLSRIAQRTQRAGVSLDQMLVSLFRGNPQAFMGDNMNRLKSGVVLNVPGADAAARVGGDEARSLIQAQSADFAAYRQRLASGTTTTADETPARQASGRVQTQVEDRKLAAAPTPDKLTLSQGNLKANAPEAQASKDAERRDASARVAELSRNVEELRRLQGATGPASRVAAAPTPPPAVAPPPPPPPAVVPPPPPPPPAPVVAPPPPPTAAAAAAASSILVTPPPALTQPTMAAAPSTPPPAAAPAEPEASFMESLLDNPLLLPLGGVLLAVILGLGLYRLRGRARKPGGETSFLESRLQPDSFFGASGGQRIDTREGGASQGAMSSMSYSLSQLDAIGDVDPVAEADVYLAYGRDLQAEEILKEAMRSTPERMAIRLKLLEVYVKRRDTKGFELLATQVYSLTRGGGDDWAKAQEFGRQIDPENPLYTPGGEPALEVGPGGKVIEALDATTLPHSAKPTPPSFVPADDARLDVDLDLDLGGVPTVAPPLPDETTRMPPSTRRIADDSLLDFEPPSLDAPTTSPGNLDHPRTITQPRREDTLRPSDGTLDFELDNTGFAPSQQATTPGALPTRSEPALDFGDFGIGDDNDATTAGQGEGSPLARKLELAEEFRQIGDLEGARDLLEEVVAKADGALKTKAQGMLASLG